MHVKDDARVYSPLETLVKGASKIAKAAPSGIEKAGSYVSKNIKPKLEFKEDPNFVSGFTAPFAVTGVQAVKNLAAKKGVLPLLTTAKPFNMSAASVPMNVVNLAKDYTAGKGFLPPNEIYANKGKALEKVMESLSNSVVTGAPNVNPGTANFDLGTAKIPLNADKLANAANTAAASTAAPAAASAAQGGISWHDITTAGAGALGLVGAVALTKLAKAGAKKVKRAHALMKADKQVERERNSARLKVLEDSGLADPSDRKRALALPPASYGVGEFSALDAITNLGSKLSSATSGILKGAAKSADSARKALFSGDRQTYGLKDKLVSKINIGDIGDNSRTKIIKSQSQGLEKASGHVADFFDKRAERQVNKIGNLQEQLDKVTDEADKARIKNSITKAENKAQRNLGIKELVSDSTKAATEFAKENPKIVLGVEGAVKSAAKTGQMNARARADEAEAQRLNAQSK